MIRPSFSLHAEGGSSISWGSVEMIAEGGQYRLCWCGRKPSPDFQHRTNSSSGVPVVDRLGPSPVDNGNVSNETPPGMGTPWTLPHLCHTLEDFRVDLGSLHIVGPGKSNPRTCVSGRTCEIESVLGHGLSVADRWMVLDTCSPRSVTEGYGVDNTYIV